MTLATLAIGSNLGDRLKYLQSAIDGLLDNSQIKIINISQVYETKPMGGPQQDNFLNAVVEIDTSLSPDELLSFIQKLEFEANRVREVHWGPRTLDVDILVYGDLVSKNPNLTIPHPRISERPFVLIPWYEISPEITIPELGNLKDLFNQISKTDVQLNGDMKLQVTR